MAAKYLLGHTHVRGNFQEKQSLIFYNDCSNGVSSGDGEIAQWLRALAALAEDPGSVPSF